MREDWEGERDVGGCREDEVPIVGFGDSRHLAEDVLGHVCFAV